MTKKLFLPLFLLGSSLLLGLNAMANVTAVTCSTSPTTVNTNSTYTVSFRTSGTGNLALGADFISITFPANTTLPASIAPAQISVSTGVPTAVTYTPSIAGQTLTFLCPINVGNSTTTTVVISTGTTNLVNPSIALTTYKVQVKTTGTGDTTNVNSSNYTIALSGTSVIVGNVNATPATVGLAADYSFTFNTSVDGFLWGGNSQIVLVFPGTTSVPVGALTGITVGGGATTATGSGGNTITLTPAGDIAGSTSNITIHIPVSVNVTNPTSAGSVQLAVSTSAQPSGNSNPYSITAIPSLTAVSTTLTNYVISNYSQYNVLFTTDTTTGALTGGVSTVTIAFPSDTLVHSGALTGVTVNGTAASATGDGAQTVVVTVPNSLPGNTAVTVMIPTTANNVRNRNTAGATSLQVQTSAQPTNVGANYTLITSATSLTAVSTTLSNYVICNVSQYNVLFTTDTTTGALVGGTSTITITYLSDTLVHNGALTGVTVNGSAASATGDGAQTVVVTVPNNLPGNTAVTVMIPTTASNVRNRTTAGATSLQVKTSTQPTNVGANYTLITSATSLTAVSTTLSNYVIGNYSQYNVLFTTDTTTGALVGGTSTVTITYLSDTLVHSGALTGVTVNGTAASATGDGAQTVVVTVPNSLAGNTAVTVMIPTTANNVRNRTTAGATSLQVQTSTQPTNVGANYTLITSGTALTAVSTTLSNYVICNYSQYNVLFTTDTTTGALVGGTSTITITYLSDTLVHNGALTGVTVNGTAASATGDGAQTVVVTVPNNLPGNTAVTVMIPTTASNVRNRTTAGATSLQVQTSAQPTNVGANYTLITSGTSLTAVSTTLTNYVIGNYSQYNVLFTTDTTTGALISGISTITIAFPSDTLVHNGALTGVTVNGTAASATGDGAQTVVVTVPNSLAGNTAVTVMIPTTANNVRNRTTAGATSLQVQTSTQPTNVGANYTLTASLTPLTAVSTTLSNYVICNVSQYNVFFTTDTTTGALIGGASTITIAFPSDTLVHNGALTGVTVNGSAASATGDGAQTVVVTVPNSLPGNTAVTVMIPTTANNVRNRTTAGATSLQVQTSVQPTNVGANYTLTTSASSVNVTGVTPLPNTVANNAQYTVVFTTSADGNLVGGTSVITIVFPAGTNVHNGPLTGVTVNSVAAVATGTSATQTVTVTVPANLGGSATVTVVIPVNTPYNLQNPVTAQAYSLVDVHTSTQPTLTASLAYNIVTSANPVGITSVLLAPSTIGNPSQYTITFTTDATNGGLGAGNSQIVITFPSDTAVLNGPIGGITVNGVGAASATGNAGARTITVVPSQDFGSSASVPVSIPSTGLLNPTTVSPPPYNLQVHTTSQPNDGSGGNYSTTTFGSPVTGVAVLVDYPTIGNYSKYTVSLTTDLTRGHLVGGISQIVLTFPAGTTLFTGAIAGVTVNGVAASSAQGNNATGTITVVPGADIGGGATFSVMIPLGNAIRNPLTINDYTLQVHTSPQPSDGSNATPYHIGTSGTRLAVGAVTVTPNTVGNIASYATTITTANDGGLVGGVSTITVTFPAGTTVPNGVLATAGLTVNTVDVDSANGSGQTITLTVHQDIAAGTPNVPIFFPDTLNIRNPTTSNNYQLTIATSVQTISGNSGLYFIGTSSSNLTIGAVTVTPNTIGNLAEYSFSFNTSSDGALVGGTSQLTIVFPGTTSVPAAPSLVGLTIGTVQVDAATGSGNTLTLTIHQNIAAGTNNIVVDIPVTSGIRNPLLGGNYTLQAATSAQPSNFSPLYAIVSTNNAVNISYVAVSPNTVGTGGAAYSLTVTTSSDAPLFGGNSHIFITLPNDTLIPGAVGPVTVNGVSTPATGSGQTIDIALAAAQSFPGATTLSIIIPSSPGLQNPTYASTGNTLEVITSSQSLNPGISPNYTIALGGPVTVTVPTPPNPNPSPNEVNVAADYTINLTLSVVQRANKGQITIYFPASAQIVNGPVTGATINGGAISLASATGNQAGSYMVLVPSVDMVPGIYAIHLPNGVLLNPSTSGINTLSIQTTAQGLGNGTFTLNSDSTPSNNTISKPDVVNAPDGAGAHAQYTISFSVAFHGRLTTGNTINLQFPAGTGMPASFPAGTITINGVPIPGVVTPVANMVALPVPAGVNVANNGGAVTIVFTLAAGLINPVTPSFGWQLTNCYTDAEPTPVVSNYYRTTANTHVTAPTVVPSPAAIFANAQYTITFNLGTSGSLTTNNDSIFLAFTGAMTIPSTMVPASITVNGTPATVVSYHFGNIVQILSPVNVANSGLVTIIFSTATGLLNPSLPGNYTLMVHTTFEPQDVTSSPYTITPSTGTNISSPQVDVFPAFTRSAGRYKINFNLGSLGGLTAGISTITVDFTNASGSFQLPATIPANMITLNGQVLGVPATSAGQILTITVPASLGVGAPVELIITSHSGIINPPVVGDYNLHLYTSSEPTSMISNTFHLASPTWSDVIVYPNPITKKDSVNKAFTFFLIPSNTATLKVYTLDGRLVKTVSKNDTTDKMTWDLNNEKGSPIASGIYLYVITGEGGNKKGKLAVKN